MLITNVDLLKFGETLQPATLELVRTSHVEIAIIPFTAEGSQVSVHYRSEVDIQGFNLCNGPGCLFCRIGHKADQRILLPVFLPTSGEIGVLPVSPSMTPHSLLPQVIKALKSEDRCIIFIRREGSKYFVQQTDLTQDVEGGEEIITGFLDRYNRGEIDLAAVYNRVDNESLAQAPEIARMMALKGIQLDADKR